MYSNEHITQEKVDRLSPIVFRDIYINGFGIRILGVHFMDYGQGWEINNHRHSFYEFHYVLDGKVNSVINGEEHEIRKGYWYIMPPGTKHSHFQNKGTSHKGIALRWEYIERHGDRYENTFEPERMFNSANMEFNLCPIKDDGSVLKAIEDTVKKAQFEKDILITQLASVLLIKNILSLSAGELQKEGRIENGEPNSYRAVKMAKEFIDENYCEKISANDVAQSVHISYSHLAKLFREAQGTTLVNYISEVRARKALKLLKCTDKPLSQIADETGFSNTNYFCKVFKKIHKKTPGRAREENIKMPDE